MPSSEKTYHLALNKWHGGDKPKKDDFNSDNSLVDAAYGRLSDSVQAAQERVDAVQAAVGDAQQAVQALESHTENNGIHVTQADKTLWNSLAGMQPGDSMVIGAYTGDGGPSKKIATTGKPKLGLFFAVEKGPVVLEQSTQTSECYFGYFSAQGSSLNVTVQNDGFTVAQSMSAPSNGHWYKYNVDGQTYVYAYWPE